MKPFLFFVFLLFDRTCFASPKSFLELTSVPSEYSARFLGEGEKLRVGSSESAEFVILLDADHALVMNGAHFYNLQQRLRQQGDGGVSRVTEIFHGPQISGYCGIFDEDMMEYLSNSPEVCSIEENTFLEVIKKSDQDISVQAKPHHYQDRSQILELTDPSEFLMANKTNVLESLELIKRDLTNLSDTNAILKPKVFGGELAKHFKRKTIEQLNPPWNLERISAKRPESVPATGFKYPFGDRYIYPSTGGAGVSVYVVDTGIFVEHPEFDGRAKWGFTVPSDSNDKDEQGHGTHVAATIGGKTFGIAKNVSLVAIKVFDGRGGPVSNVIRGLAWALHDALESKTMDPSSKVITTEKKIPPVLAVINLSITIPQSASITSVAKVAARKGILIVAAAGNSAKDACSQALHLEPSVLSVGAYCYDYSIVTRILV